MKIATSSYISCNRYVPIRRRNNVQGERAAWRGVRRDRIASIHGLTNCGSVRREGRKRIRDPCSRSVAILYLMARSCPVKLHEVWRRAVDCKGAEDKRKLANVDRGTRASAIN